MNTSKLLHFSIGNLKNAFAYLLFGIIILQIACSKKAEIQPVSKPETTKSVSISSFSPTAGAVGTKVVILGNNFSTALSDNIVKFGAVAAVVDSATTTRLVTKVPKDAVDSKITVEVAGKSVATITDFGVSAELIINPFIDVTNATGNITDKSISVTSTIKNAGSNKILKFGHVWSKTNNPPSIADSKTENDATEGPFPLKVVSELKNLEAFTTYYVRTYATTSGGTFYGIAFEVKTILVTEFVNIPDPNFEQALIDISIDKDGVLNGKVSAKDLYNIKSLSVKSKKIKDFTGIEGFINLEDLDCNNNLISKGFNLEKNLQLKTLNCSNNQIPGFLALGNNIKLEILDCNYNKLTGLVLAGNPLLKRVDCISNELIVFSLGQNDNLEYLNCNNNKLEKIIANGTYPKLTTFNCNKNLINQLDVSKMAKLLTLQCASNNISNLDLNSNTELSYLDCSINQIKKLDVGKNSKLNSIYCSGNQLEALDISKNIILSKLSAAKNKFKTFETSHNPVLDLILLQQNELTTLDFSKNLKLKNLQVFENQLNEINILNNVVLQSFYCEKNKLQKIDISKNLTLEFFNSQSNEGLKTICVADVDKAKNNNAWKKDSTVEYKKCE